MTGMHGKEKSFIKTISMLLGDSNKFKLVGILYDAGCIEDEKPNKNEYTRKGYESSLALLMKMDDSCVINTLKTYIGAGNKPVPLDTNYCDADKKIIWPKRVSVAKKEIVYHAMVCNDLLKKTDEGYALDVDLFNDLKLITDR